MGRKYKFHGQSGSVRNPPDYLYGSAIDYYADEKALLPIAGLS
ncbi:MAG: hypothetical protein V4577_07290 [Bacteroidota bacterium]